MKWPATGEEIREAGYHYTDAANCKGCGAHMLFFQTPNGKQMPMVRMADGKWQPHFIDCPKSKEFQRKKKHA